MSKSKNGDPNYSRRGTRAKGKRYYPKGQWIGSGKHNLQPVDDDKTVPLND